MASSSEQNSVFGITLGFVFGLLVVFGLERVVGYLENIPPSMFQSVSVEESQHGISLSGFTQISRSLEHVQIVSTLLFNSMFNVFVSGTEDNSPRKRTFTYPEGAGPADFLEEGDAELAHSDDDDGWEDEPVNRASQAIAAPEHRDHIREHLGELLEVVKSMEDKSNQLLEVNHLPALS